jgi:hypothetical protein
MTRIPRVRRRNENPRVIAPSACSDDLLNAAAPDLLAACKAALADVVNRASYEQVKAAILKAGEPLPHWVEKK